MSGHAALKYFSQTVEFGKFLIMKLSYTTLFPLKVVLIDVVEKRLNTCS